MSKDVNFLVNNKNIHGYVWGDDSKLSSFIYLHGAGTSDYTRMFSYIHEGVLNQTSNVAAVDFIGHGKSEGTVLGSSIKERCEVAKNLIDEYSTKDKLTICGSSMGGYIAIKMLEIFNVENLILFAPGIYTTDAYSAEFGMVFSGIIREEKSWCKSDAFDILSNFRGNLIVVIGDEDEVIPKELVDLLLKSANKAKFKEVIVLPNCPHALNYWLDNNPEAKREITNKISKLL